MCKAIDNAGDYSYPSLCIEVTVSNTISQERRNRIREVGLPALEMTQRPARARHTGQTETPGRHIHCFHVKKWIYNPVVTQKFLDLEKRSRHWLQRKTKPSKRRGPKCGA